ncbi:MAG TPA: cyclic pyranopterin monophosphate synthase MoaC [Nitrospinaceae bacterium]|jgi:cyclic pyranopterin phosphate synthase|nr:cyclic pyranopterin monophosphate synthase MoaC [Nitrospinaceae bacterium]|tara:strand:- start:16972 stop:17496 length:525 start_codon:yes stop_codon:yes gene_type:complete
MTNPLTHFNEEGRARMVDVGKKNITERVAVAIGEVHLRPETMRLIKEGEIKKGDVLAVAQVAGIMGAKKTPDVIPMCHPLLLTNVDIAFTEELEPAKETGLCCIKIKATVKVTGQTGVEMEALTAVSIAALTIYDMCKAVDREMYFTNIGLLQKSGGKSGAFSKDKVGTTPSVK